MPVTADERADGPPRPYGNVTYADPENGKYPIDSEEHARAALAYFSMPKNQAGYSPEQVRTIMGRIRAACRRFGIHMADDNTTSRADHAEIETRDADVKDVNYAQRIITVIAAPYEQPAVINYKGEAWNEMFMRTAWDGLRDKRPTMVRANRDHNKARTVGKVVGLFPERDEGLVTEIRVAKTQLGDETLALADEDCLSSSVGFGVLPSGQELDKATRTRRITTAYLDHIAFVESPAYAGASVIGVRHNEPAATSEQLELFAKFMKSVLSGAPTEERKGTPYLDEFTGAEVFRWASERLRRT